MKNKKINKFINKTLTEKLLDGCSNYNSLEVRISCRSKKQGRDMFKRGNIPHADGKIFFGPLAAYQFVKKHGFPVCIKPNLGGYSRGSYFPINNYKELYKAVLLAKIWWPISVIEKYLLGKNYRVVVTKDTIEVAIQRYTPFIIGDGKKTIGELIDIENKIRIDMRLLPIIHEIGKNYLIKTHLKKQGLNFDSIVKKDQRIELFYRVSLAPGGVLKNIGLDTITEKNKKIFFKILKLFKANVFGIDVIMEKGIDIDFDKQKTIFLEVNSRPYLKMHDFPRYGKKPDLTKMYEKLNSIELENKDLY